MDSDRLIFRNDDVSPSSNFDHIKEMYDFLTKNFPGCEIWSCISMFSLGAAGSVYPDLPLSSKPVPWFYNADRIWKPRKGLKTIVSHGLYHLKHTQVHPDAQKMSIVGSCNLLNTKIFVPPFTDYNDSMQSICDSYGIRLVKDTDGWKSLESDPFNSNHKLWFFHSWRFTPGSFADIFLDVLAKGQSNDAL